jgi:hypothetical protein
VIKSAFHNNGVLEKDSIKVLRNPEFDPLENDATQRVPWFLHDSSRTNETSLIRRSHGQFDPLENDATQRVPWFLHDTVEQNETSD